MYKPVRLDYNKNTVLEWLYTKPDDEVVHDNADVCMECTVAHMLQEKLEDPKLSMAIVTARSGDRETLYYLPDQFSELVSELDHEADQQGGTLTAAQAIKVLEKI